MKKTAPESILVIDTSTSACCLAIKAGDRTVEDVEIVGRSHSEIILPKIMALLDGCELTLHDLQLIIFGQGPGSFTGLRIAVGVAQGLSFGLDIPLVPVSGLACLAQREYRKYGSESMLVAMEARKEEVYWGTFQIVEGIARPVSAECVIDVSDLSVIESGSWVGVGSGWKLKQKIEAGIGQAVKIVRTEVQLQPLDLLTLGLCYFKEGRYVQAEDAQPMYLREVYLRKV
jgi:tRNA threonylcarbamoyladenosine biosynthesis protein TsaB